MNEIPLSACTIAPIGASVVATTGDNFELSASTPTEMVQCHQQAIVWCRRKIELVTNETTELCVAYKYAKKQKWKCDVLKRHWLLSERRLTFYKKMLLAFEAGYYIVPNFPATVFAIRTEKDLPDGEMKLAYTYEPRMTQEVDRPLPAGEGEYQNPEPSVMKSAYQKDDGRGGKTNVADYWPANWEKMEFPANMAKLHIMDAATRAMALKVFDEVCMLPSDKKRHADPILIGRIVLKTNSRYNSDWTRVSFMLAWHVDTKTL